MELLVEDRSIASRAVSRSGEVDNLMRLGEMKGVKKEEQCREWNRSVGRVFLAPREIINSRDDNN